MLIFGPRKFSVLHGKKNNNNNNKIVGSFNGISTTCKSEIVFFFHNSEISDVSHVIRNGIKSKMTHSRDSDMAVAREFRSCLSKFHCRNEVTQGHKVQAIKL